jgi:hypothetical protein
MLGDRAPKFARGFDPVLYDDFCVCDCVDLSLAVGHAAGEFGNFDNETVVVIAPVNPPSCEATARQVISS